MASCARRERFAAGVAAQKKQRLTGLAAVCEVTLAPAVRGAQPLAGRRKRDKGKRNVARGKGRGKEKRNGGKEQVYRDVECDPDMK